MFISITLYLIYHWSLGKVSKVENLKKNILLFWTTKSSINDFFSKFQSIVVYAFFKRIYNQKISL